MASFTTAQLLALEQAIAQGASSCEFDGMKTTFRSLDDMLALRNLMRTDLGIAPRTKRIKMKFYKGLTSES